MALRTNTDQASVDSFADRRIPSSGTLIASGDYKSVDPAPAEFHVPFNTNAIEVVIDFTAQSGAANTLTTTIEGWNPASQTWSVVASPAADATGGAHTKKYKLSPYLTTADPLFNITLWETMRVKVVGSGTRTTLNYSVGLHCS